MGRLGMTLITAAVGVVVYWAVTTPGTGLRVSTVGVVLMVGGVGLIASMIVLAASRRQAGRGDRS
jgi:VIT1/CCC1 family predicted Fe2+/Mn2+ transporter